MKTSRTVLALGGVFLASSGLLWGQAAMAFGPQWRPAAPAPAVSHQRAAHRFASVANFRPSATGTPAATAHATGRWPARPMTSRAQPRSFQPQLRPATSSSYVVNPQRNQPHYAAAAPQRYRAFPRVGYHNAPAPMWMPSHMAAAPAWQAPPRYLPAPQVAWQRPAPPIGYPTGYQPPPLARSGYPVSPWQPPLPTAAMFRPQSGFSQAMPASMRWRPVAAVPRSTTSHATPHAVSKPNRWVANPAKPVWRGQPDRVMPNVSAVSPRFLKASRSWRPEPRRFAQHDRNFRPAAYGRSDVEEQRLAELSAMPMTSPRATGLPGWATTYQEIESDFACGWCNGS